MKRRDHRPRASFDLNRAESSLDRIELLVKRPSGSTIGELRALMRWGANMAVPASPGGDLGYRRAPGHSSPTENHAGDTKRAAIDEAVQKAAQAVKRADDGLENAYGALLDALGGRQTLARGGDAGSWTSRKELEERKAFQRKNEAQGGGFGGS